MNEEKFRPYLWDVAPDNLTEELFFDRVRECIEKYRNGQIDLNKLL